VDQARLQLREDRTVLDEVSDGHRVGAVGRDQALAARLPQALQLHR
jgi:hypothetical protein